MIFSSNVGRRDPRLVTKVAKSVDEEDTGIYMEDSVCVIDIDNVDTDIATKVITKPFEVFFNIEVCFEEELDYELEDIRILNAPETTVQDIRSDDFGKVRSIVADVTQTSSQYGKPSLKRFTCVNCGWNTTRGQPIYIDDKQEPHSCGNGDCNHSTFDEENVETEDSQTVIIQDLPEIALNTKDMECRLFGELVNEFEVGERVEMTVVVKEFTDEKRNREYPRLLVLDAKAVDKQANIEVTDDDAGEFEQMTEEQDMLQYIVENIAPGLVGREITRPKYGTILSMFSGDWDENKRDTINTLIIGEPSTSKSKLTTAIENVAPHSATADAGNSTKVGLTAALVGGSETDEDYTIKAGTFVQANGGLAIIDELDKMSDRAYNGMYQPLSEQTVEVRKAESKKLPAEAATIAAANPKHDIVKDTQPISEQIEFPAALLSRFDLIYIVLDKTDEDDEVADAILNEDETSEEMQEFLTKYTKYAKQNYHPELNEEAKQLLKTNWTGIRGESTSVKKIDARALMSLKRMTKSISRIRLRDEATKEDAKDAWGIYIEALESVVRLADGELDTLVQYRGTSDSQHQRRQDIIQTVQEMDSATESDIEDALSTQYDPVQVRQDVEQMKSDGKLFILSGELNAGSQPA